MIELDVAPALELASNISLARTREG
jgi:hypothetical protein